MTKNKGARFQKRIEALFPTRVITQYRECSDFVEFYLHEPGAVTSYINLQDMEKVRELVEAKDVTTTAWYEDDANSCKRCGEKPTHYIYVLATYL